MELQVEGELYQIGKMDAFTQLHVTRKLGSALPLIEGLVREQNKGKDMSLMMVLLMSRLTDDETEYVTEKCLNVVSRKQAQGWAKVQSGGQLMFADTTMGAVIQLTAAVITENLGDFFRTALANLEGQNQTPPV